MSTFFLLFLAVVAGEAVDGEVFRRLQRRHACGQTLSLALVQFTRPLARLLADNRRRSAQIAARSKIHLTSSVTTTQHSPGICHIITECDCQMN